MNEEIKQILSDIKAALGAIKAENEQSARRSMILKKNVWNVSELALYLGRSADRVSRMAHQRLFPSYRQNGQYYFKREEIEAWLTAHRSESLDELDSRAALHVLKSRLS